MGHAGGSCRHDGSNLSTTVERHRAAPHLCRIALAAIVASMAFAIVAASTHGAPFTPSDDSQVLERLPAASNTEARTLRRLHAALSQTPNQLDLALRVAQRDMELGRAEADPRYNGYAEAALAPWWSLENPPIPVLLMRATLRQSRHDFRGALDDLSHVTSVDRDNAQAWLTRATILQVQGDYAQADESCRALLGLARPLIAATCTNSVASLNGHALDSYRDLRRVFEREAATAGVQIRLWALTVLAEMAARLGDDHTAEAHFGQAFSLGLRDAYLLGAYADFLLDHQRAAEVRDLLRDQVRIDPLLLRLALAERLLAAPECAAHIAELRERFANSRARGDTTHRREEARFSLHLLNEPERALQLAEANWFVQREPWDTRLLLEAALAARMYARAAPVLDWLTATRLEDAQVRRLVEELGRRQQ